MERANTLGIARVSWHALRHVRRHDRERVMDPIVVGFQPLAGSSLSELYLRMEQELDAFGGATFRHWRGASTDYVAIDYLDVASSSAISDLEELGARANAEMTGLARLVVDTSLAEGGEAVSLRRVLTHDPGADVALPATKEFIDAEVLVCPICGGMNKHFSPPH